MWYIDITGFDTHAEIADTLSKLGVKRIYVKVVDGGINPTIWPEILDQRLVADYKSKGLEVWAWSYNYPGNNIQQAMALYQAAETGYDGYVVDVEVEFDGDFVNLNALFSAFHSARNDAINDGFINPDFKIYSTTWGNPADHNYRIDAIDPWVDGYMPQTYVENWGQSFIDNLEYWIDVGNKEFIDLGATKPIHHIVSTEKGIFTSEQVNSFIQHSGSETSIWRIPGGEVPQSIWETWEEVNWDYVCACDEISGFQYENYFTGTEDNNWTNPLNWSLKKVPDSCHKVVIGAGKTIEIPSNTEVKCYAFELRGDARLHIGKNVSLYSVKD